MARKFVGRPLKPTGAGFLSAATGSEPPVPRAFLWEDQVLEIVAVLRSWRTTKHDRGDVYLKRHWFELRTKDDARIEVYYDREARRGTSQWWLYAIESW